MSFIHNVYKMEPNLCRYRDIAGQNFIVYCYLFVVLCSLVVYAILLLRIRQESRRPVPAFLIIMRRVAFGTLGLITFVQFKTQMVQFHFEHNNFSGKSLTEKHAAIFPETYEFAEYCQTHFPGRVEARFVSDHDIKKADGLYSYTEIAYFLYPLDIKKHENPDPEAIVIFDKGNPRQSVPSGFRSFSLYNEKSLLAVHETLWL